MKYYLGIDGGGTKTQFLLADEELNIVSEYTGPTCHYLQCGFTGLTNVLSEGIMKICRKTKGIDRSCIEAAFIGCAGYGDSKANKAPIELAVRSAMINIPFGIGNDCENALAGALRGEDGINLIAGTGSMACGKLTIDGSSRIERCGGWHHVIGSDEGSAYWISWNLLKEFTRQSDGRDQKTALYEMMLQELNLSSDDELITRIIDEWQLDRGKIAALCPICSKLYDEGDPHAIRIINEAARELSDMAIAIYRELGFKGTVKVSGTGGVFKMGDKLTAPLAEILEQNSMRFVPPAHSPGIGSVILAKQVAKRI